MVSHRRVAFLLYRTLEETRAHHQIKPRGTSTRVRQASTELLASQISRGKDAPNGASGISHRHSESTGESISIAAHIPTQDCGLKKYDSNLVLRLRKRCGCCV